MSLIQSDFQSIIEHFLDKRTPDGRYTSFDYCYNHFHPKNEDKFENDIEKSCLALGFYLASWGMYRGSSFLLNNSAHRFVNVVEYFATLDKSVWDIDADKYSEEIIERLIEIYAQVKVRLIGERHSHLTLVTKVMLGVFGNVPAYDRYFTTSFRDMYRGRCAFRHFNQESLSCIAEFYKANAAIIDSLRTQTIDFKTQDETRIIYPRAKIIDMYGFSKSLV